jgi:hypothetical protein
MTDLILTSTRRYFGFGDKNDYVVLGGGRVIGRIMLHPQAPEGHPWFWSITTVDKPLSIYNKGYSVERCPHPKNRPERQPQQRLPRQKLQGWQQ